METFLYLNFGQGRVTVAIKEQNNLLKIGAAFCSPSDQFIKEYGRKLALDRLNNKKDFYICFEKENSIRIKEQVCNLIKFIISGQWVSKLDVETELGLIVYEIITESENHFSNDIAPMVLHTNIIPTWAKHAKNF